VRLLLVMASVTVVLKMDCTQGCAGSRLEYYLMFGATRPGGVSTAIAVVRGEPNPLVRTQSDSPVRKRVRRLLTLVRIKRVLRIVITAM